MSQLMLSIVLGVFFGAIGTAVAVMKPEWLDPLRPAIFVVCMFIAGICLVSIIMALADWPVGIAAAIVLLAVGFLMFVRHQKSTWDREDAEIAAEAFYEKIKSVGVIQGHREPLPTPAQAEPFRSSIENITFVGTPDLKAAISLRGGDDHLLKNITVRGVSKAVEVENVRKLEIDGLSHDATPADLPGQKRKKKKKGQDA